MRRRRISRWEGLVNKLYAERCSSDHRNQLQYVGFLSAFASALDDNFHRAAIGQQAERPASNCVCPIRPHRASLVGRDRDRNSAQANGVLVFI